MKLFTIEEAKDLLPCLRMFLRQLEEENQILCSLTPLVREAQNRAHLGGGSLSGPVFLRRALKFHYRAAAIQGGSRLGVRGWAVPLPV